MDCTVCGAPVARVGGANACSVRCSRIRDRQSVASGESRAACVVCGAAFVCPPPWHKNTCSSACARARRTELERIAQKRPITVQPRRRIPAAAKPCAKCGGSFLPSARAGAKRYCSTACAKLARRESSRRCYQKRLGSLDRFGLTPAGFERLAQRQGRVCAICGEPERPPRRLAVDHDHATGRVRGLLCGRCNRALYLVERGLAARALAYLRGETEKRLDTAEPLGVWLHS